MNTRLPKRTCKRKGCDTVFQKQKPLDMFCSPLCGTLHQRDLEEKRSQKDDKKPTYRIPQISQKRLDEQAEYRMLYKDLEAREVVKILTELNTALDLKLKISNLRSVREQLDELRPPAEGFDPVTLLTSTHPKK